MNSKPLIKENEDFLTCQIITYLGNKRLLLKDIEYEILKISKKLSKEKMVCADIFSGSGIAARLFKRFSSKLYVNDLEKYSAVINSCYLTDKEKFDEAQFDFYYNRLNCESEQLLTGGIIYKNYAPQNDENIKEGERVFYTAENAKIIDTLRSNIEKIPPPLKPFFLAPLIYEASVHVNTGGVFKGFYKDSKTGLGKFGGNGGHALTRIKKKICLQKPVFSNFSAPSVIMQDDSNSAIKKIHGADIIYIDPPYNQHPYGSNYFMLNVIAENKLPKEISRVSGIPANWNRSVYNKKAYAFSSFSKLIEDADSKYLIISYSDEGIMNVDEIKRLLKKHGTLEVRCLPYNTYRASRNLQNRNLHLNEYIFVLKKK